MQNLEYNAISYADMNYLQNYDKLNNTENIKTVIPSLNKQYENKFIIIDSNLYIVKNAPEEEKRWAKDVGVETLDIDIDSNNTLISSNKNSEKLVINGTLVIPSMVKNIGEGAFSNLELENVVIPSNVKEIGRNAFANNTNIKEVTIQYGCEVIRERAFSNCTNLTKISMEDSVKTIEGRAFEGCKALGNVTLSDSITVIGFQAFASCSAIKNITLPSKLEKLGGGTFGATSIEEIEFPEGLKRLDGSDIPSTIKKITTDKNNYFVFENGILYNKEKTDCIYAISTLAEVQIDEKVNKILTGAFYKCTELKSINIPKNVTEIENNVFSSSLTEITVSNENNYFCADGKNLYNKDKTILYKTLQSGNVTIAKGVKTIATGAFVTGIKSISLPDTYEGADAWGTFPNLTELTLPASTKTLNKGAYYRVQNLKVASDNPYFKITNDGNYILSKDGKKLYWTKNSLSTVEIPNGVEELEKYSLSYLTKISELTIPSTVIKINDAVIANSAITKVIIPSSVSNITSGAFATTKLNEIVIQKEENSISGAPWQAPCGNKGVSWEKQK